MGRKTYLIIAAVVIVVIVVIVVPPLVLLLPKTSSFRAKFREKCLAFPETSQRCENVLSTFEESYTGKDSCNFPETAYDRVFMENPFTHSCGKMMFWSDTNDLVHKFTEKRDHFITLEDTLLGYIMNDMTWCGKKGSKETFTYPCKNCEINTISSFWSKASAEFADYTCGDTTVMLNGQSNKPFDPNSYFGKIELKRLKYPKVKSLTVILITKNNKKDCSQESLQDLKTVLDPQITYFCHAVSESRIEDCIDNSITSEACWSKT